MICDCKNDDILELGDGLQLCLQCRTELELTKGAFCRAHSVRRDMIEEANRLIEAKAVRDERLPEPHVPRQYHTDIVSFSRVERPKTWNPRPTELPDAS